MKLIAAAFVLLSAAPLSAQDATLAAVMGKVSIHSEGENRYLPVKAGDSLLYSDAVKTGPNSLAHILFPDGSAVLVKENSRLVLQGTPRKTIVSFSIGEFLIGIKKKLAPGQSFKVRTPAAVAAVRGTLFWGKVEKNGGVQFAGLGHTVSVRAKGKTVLLKAGLKTSVSPGSPPTEPQPHDIPASYAKTFAVGDSIQGLEALLEQ
jgi:hypothetical protein